MKCIGFVGGSHSLGVSGVSVDLEAARSFGAHAGTVISAVTAEGQNGLSCNEAVSLRCFREQLESLRLVEPSVIKVGLIPNGDLLRELCSFLETTRAFLIWDPVLANSAGNDLVDQTFLEVSRTLLHRTDLFTPNALEAKAYSGKELSCVSQMPSVAKALKEMGARQVLIKGGHVEGAQARDYFLGQQDAFWLMGKKSEVGTVRGTGCCFAAVVGANLACGTTIEDSLTVAKAYTARAISMSRPSFGLGSRLHHGSWPVRREDFPRVSDVCEPNEAFLTCPQPIGLYPIVPNSQWVQRLCQLGVPSLQLRIKQLSGNALESEIVRSIEIAKETHCQLFINDYWELAIKHQAFGVHLGQEDLRDAELTALRESGLRLGISTHSYSELARALSYRPSYLALGPIYPTTSKPMRFSPQGLETLKIWRELMATQLVAIGGLSVERAKAVMECGVDGISVITDIIQNKNPNERVKQWLQLFPKT